MSSLFNQASLVVEPAVYETSKVYATKPFDGTGDLTFTRSNDTATRVNSSGLVERVRTNEILQSQNFSTAWSATNASVTINTTANPLNGALDADTITLGAGTASKNLSQGYSHSGTFTQSVYLKAGTHQFVQLLLGDDTSPKANFDLINGTANATGSTATIVSVGGGWYRCSMSYTTPFGSVVYLWAVDSLTALRAESTSSTGTFFAFGFQLETGDIATDYIATTSAAVSVGPVANVPRLDYLNSSCPRLLLEPQRTNSALFSEQFNNAAYSSLTVGSATAAIVTANFATSPDGYQNADRLQFSRTGTTSSDLSLLQQSAIVLSATGTATIYLKSNTSSTQNVLLYWGGGQGIVFAVTPEWQRFTLPNLAAGTDTILIGTRGGSGSFYNGGDLTLDVLAYGLQIEAGAYATSYIPTLGAAVTRGADLAQKTSASALIGQTQGTIFWEIDLRIKSATGSDDLLNLDTGSFGNTIYLYKVPDGRIAADIYVSSVQQASFVLAAASVNVGIVKMALGYANNNSAFFVNGVQVGTTDTSCSIPATSRIQLGNTAVGESFSRTAQLIVFPTRLSNSDLAALTA